MARFDRGQVQVVNLVGTEALPDLDASLREWGWTAWRLDGSRVVDAQSLWARSGIDLPDPFPVRPLVGFDAYADALRAAAATSPADDVALVWTQAHQMLEGGLGDLLTAVSVLRRASQQLAALDPAAGGPTALYTFLVGEGPNFP